MSTLDVGASGRLRDFLGILAFLVIGASTLSWLLAIDIMTLGPLYMFTPLLAAVIVCWRHDISLHQVGFRFGRRRWLLVGAFVWPPIALLMTGLALLVPGTTFDPTPILDMTGVPNEPVWLLIGAIGLLIGMLVAGVTINTVLAFGEEFGWRGYLLWELAPLGFWKASALIGLFWGLWHTPLVLAGLNYPSFPLLGVVLFTGICMLFSPLYTYLVAKANSMLPAALLHGVFNATGFIALAGTDDPVLRELVVSDGGLIGILVMTLILVVLYTSEAETVTIRPEMAEPPSGRTKPPLDSSPTEL